MCISSLFSSAPVSRSGLLLLASLLLVAAAWAQPVDAPADQQIRVRLYERYAPQEIILTLEQGTLDVRATESGSPLASLEPSDQATIRMRDQELQVELTADAFYARELYLEPQDGTVWEVEVKQNSSAPRRSYDGALFIEPEAASAALRLVNTVNLEDYVASVVASEYGFDDLEGAKAMAVLARTYALYSANKHGTDYDHVDHPLSQAYGGRTAITPLARRATEETRGEVLTYEQAPIEAVYFSSSGGHTANNEDVWDADPLPYLRGRDDPYDSSSPHHEWRVTVNRSQLLQRLTNRFGFAVQGFRIGERSEDGRVQTIEILGSGGRSESMRSNAFRLFANAQLQGSGVRSTLFTAERSGDRYIFEGSGFGHGVGMSQYGAREMARQGHSYRDILSYYFKDVSLALQDEIIDLPALAEDDTPTEADEPSDTTDDRQAPQRRIGW